MLWEYGRIRPIWTLRSDHTQPLIQRIVRNCRFSPSETFNTSASCSRQREPSRNNASRTTSISVYAGAPPSIIVNSATNVSSSPFHEVVGCLVTMRIRSLLFSVYPEPLDGTIHRGCLTAAKTSLKSFTHWHTISCTKSRTKNASKKTRT